MTIFIWRYNFKWSFVYCHLSFRGCVYVERQVWSSHRLWINDLFCPRYFWFIISNWATKKPWLGYIGDYTTQLKKGITISHYEDPYMESTTYCKFFFRGSMEKTHRSDRSDSSRYQRELYLARMRRLQQRAEVSRKKNTMFFFCWYPRGN